MQQKFLENRDPVNTFLVEITPEQLKTLVARIEAKVKQASPGECVLTAFTTNITLLTLVPGEKPKP